MSSLADHERDKAANLNAWTWKPYDTCPCGCGVIHQKLKRNNHVIGCKCRPCLGTRNRAKGQRAQAKGHRALGGVGFTPGNEESVGGYDVRLQVEWKTGAQIPASFTKFVGLDWTRRALSQANRARRVGDGSMPAVGLIIGGKTYLVVEANRDMDGVA
jgi:hypothetical protein